MVSSKPCCKKSLSPVVSKVIQFVVFISIVASPAGILAAPEILGISGTLENGQQVTLSGTDFGPGPEVALFDDFENGDAGQPMLIGPGSAQFGQWDAKDASLGVAVYGTTSLSGNLAYESDKSHWSMHQIRYFPPGTTKVFMSYYVRMDESFGTNSWKLAWLFDGDESGDQEDDIAIPVRTQIGNWIVDGNANTMLSPIGSFYPSSDPYMVLGEWSRISFYCELTETPSGKLRLWDIHPTGGVRTLATTDGFQVAGSDQGTIEWDEVHLPGLTTNGAGHLRHDDVYIATGDNAQARIEIGNSSSYTGCTKLTFAVPENWNNSNISATVYEGAFEQGEEVYIFVVDRNGEVSAGHGPFTFGSEPPAHPVISNSSDIFIHGESATISGSGFGQKSVAAPVVWDDCSGTDVQDKWDGAWPDKSVQAHYSPQYLNPMRGVSPAHSHAKKYLAGCATGQGTGYPNNVMVWKRRTATSFPAYSYISFYTRVDPQFDGGDNFKWFDYSTGNSPYTMVSDDESNWYLEYVGGLGEYFHINDDGATIHNQPPDYTLDYLGNSKYFGASKNPRDQWVKIEMEIKYTSADDGWINLYEDGVLIKSGSAPHTYNGPTDKYAGTARNEGIGGFSRNGSSDNWRYFNDLYLDHSLARVVVCDTPSYDACSVREVQPADSWADGTIDVTVNGGRLAVGQTAYVYVIDKKGTVSAGHAITIGDSSTEEVQSPRGLSVSK